MSEDPLAPRSDPAPPPEPDEPASAGAANEPASAPADPPTPHAEDPYEGAVPPGYDWPTHGGYLGCLVGSMAGCLLTAFVSANLFSFLWAAQIVSGPVFILLTLVALVLIMWGLGRLGWGLGKRFYRAYEQPLRPVWGEDDDEAPVTEGGIVEGSIVSLNSEGSEPATS